MCVKPSFWRDNFILKKKLPFKSLKEEPAAIYFKTNNELFEVALLLLWVKSQKRYKTPYKKYKKESPVLFLLAAFNICDAST